MEWSSICVPEVPVKTWIPIWWPNLEPLVESTVAIVSRWVLTNRPSFEISEC
jgi:hypothetical protein